VHRCWLGEIAPLTVGDTVTLAPEESAHVTRVLRMKAGDRVQLIAAESLYDGQLTAADAKAATVRVLAALPSPEAVVRVTLVQGLPKADRLEWIVQKVTELGAWDVLPVVMERSEARADPADARRQRLARIAQEASKQSGRAHVPAIRPACTVADAVRTLQNEGCDAVFVAWEEEGDLRLGEALRSRLAAGPTPRVVALVIGPEGGIAPPEIERLKAAGAVCVTLGKRILRTETVGICALAVTMSALGEM
jgi:16S rRNA (uracil1498-N3)-methyltransferase